MNKPGAHSTAVDAWLTRAGSDASTDVLLERFAQAFGALTRRAQVTLSDVTLGAIVDRVLHQTRREHPALAPVEVEGPAIRCDALAARAPELDHDEIREAIRFALVELLTVVGNLTAEILTPALHAELAKQPPGGEERSQDEEPGP